MPDRGVLALRGTRLPIALAACALLLAACAPTLTPAPTVAVEPETLRLVGSTAAEPLMRALSPAFQERHPEMILQLDFEEPRSSARVQAMVVVPTLASAAFPLAVMADAPPDDLWAAPVAVDAIAVIVHPDNPIQSLTLTQLYQVFTGRTWHWSELVGSDADWANADTPLVSAEIAVVSREAGSGTRAAFENLVLRAHPEQEPAPVTTMAVLRLGSDAAIEYVAAHPEAIGYAALGALDTAGPSGAPVKVLAVEDVVPGPEAVASGAYRLSLPLFFVAPQEPTGAARQYVDFCLSPEGQAIVARKYVPVRE